MPEPEYAWCHHCARPRPLRADGTFRKHSHHMQPCPASGTYPQPRGLEDVPDPGRRLS